MSSTVTPAAMKACLLLLTLFFGQLNGKARQVVHLPPHQDYVDISYGGKLLELTNAPPLILLPASPPLVDSRGAPWAIDIKNLGPHPVRIADHAAFVVAVDVGQTVHIRSDGRLYSRK